MHRRIAALLWMIAIVLFVVIAFVMSCERAHGQPYAYAIVFTDPTPSETRPREVCVRQQQKVTCRALADLKREGGKVYVPTDGTNGRQIDVWINVWAVSTNRNPLGGTIVAQTVLAGEIAPSKRRRVAAHGASSRGEK